MLPIVWLSACAWIAASSPLPRMQGPQVVSLGPGSIFGGSASTSDSGGADWMVQGEHEGNNLGISVAGAGDVDGNGYDDLILGESRYWNGSTEVGRALVFLGSAAGLDTTPAWTAEGQVDEGFFGLRVASAGDVNGDGYDDVVVLGGGAFLYIGSASGLSSSPAWTGGGGNWVACAGDVQGDGYDDVILGEPLYGNGNDGRVLLYSGSAAGLSTNPSWTYVGSHDALLGDCVSSAGDANGDGFDDLIVGEPIYASSNPELGEGRAMLFLGSSNGPSATPDWVEQGDAFSVHFGESVSGAGDVDSDGYADVLVGAPDWPPGGRAFLFRGSATGLKHNPSWISVRAHHNAQLGDSLASAGDFDGDGYPEVFVGARHYATSDLRGAAALFRGSPIQMDSIPSWLAIGSLPLDASNTTNFGLSVAGIGDVNGDGYDDVAVGEPSFSLALHSREGRAYVYLGSVKLGVTYCTANANSTGDPANLTAWRSASATEGKLRLLAGPLPNQVAIFFHGANQAQVPFGNGFLCMTDDVARGAATGSQMQVATYVYENSDAAHSLAAFVGSTRNFQCWFRDPADGGAFFNTSNAVAIAIFP